jgi:uncharacterized protein (DUF433 family)
MLLINNSGPEVFSSRISLNSGLNIRTKNGKSKLNRGINMNTENLESRITINPKVMVGKPTIRGMRITVEQILRALAGGVTVNELLQDYPELEQEDIQAVFAYAVNLVDEEQVFPVEISA